MVRVRFAPSPTGALHIGGARTALFNYLFSRKEGGRLLLRIDDTDAERSQSAFEAEIVESLRWLGLTWDEGPDKPGSCAPYRQSERRSLHLAAAGQLEQAGLAFKDPEGVLRLRYTRSEVIINDLVCGECRFSTDSLGPEPAVLRPDGTPTYHLASVCDDIAMGITHIIRGQDHLTNTAKHLLLFEGLGAAVPAFAHLPLILGEDRSKLSKRNSEGLVSVAQFREAGYLPEAVNNFLMLLGWSHPEAKEQLSLAEAVDAFALSRVSKTAAVFETQKLDWLNGWWIRHLPADQLAQRALSFTGELAELLEARGPEYWPTAFARLRDGIHFLTEARGLAELLVAESFEVAPDELSNAGGIEEVRSVCGAWLALLEEFTPDDSDRYTEAQYGQLVAVLKKRCGKSGPALFKPLRLALMGATSGPELKVLAPLVPHRLLVSRARALYDGLCA